MRMRLTQGGLGPIVDLGMGPSGAPANLATAPTVVSSQVNDMVLIQRAGRLQKIGLGAFAGGLSGTVSTSGLFTIADASGVVWQMQLITASTNSGPDEFSDDFNADFK